MICVLLASCLYDIVHPEGVLSFKPSSKKDEYYCQQLLMHKHSLSKFGISWCQVLQRKVTHPRGGKHDFRAAHMDSLLYFYRQKYRTIFAATKCRHAAQHIIMDSIVAFVCRKDLLCFRNMSGTIVWQ